MWWLALFGLIGGCAKDSPDLHAIDLIARFDGSNAWMPTREIDFGADGDARYMLRGWGPPESLADGTSVRWGLGPRSTLEFFAIAGAPLQLTGRCWPHVYPGAPPQVVEASINGRSIGSIAPSVEHSKCDFEIASEWLRTGVNRLDFQYRYSGSPLRPGDDPTLTRPMSVLWDRLRFDVVTPVVAPPDTAKPDPTPHIAIRQGEPGRLVLPVHGRIDYYFELHPGDEIHLEGVESRGTPRDATVVLEVEADRGTRSRIPLVSGGAANYPLPIDSGGLHRLSFSAPFAGRGRGHFAIVGPQLVQRRAPTGPRLAPRAPAPAPPHARRPNVIIYLVDALRADHLGAYGYTIPTSPSIDAFARQAVLFRNVDAESSWTRPTVASILTGLSIRSHNIIDLSNGLSESIQTLAETLSDSGYDTAAFTLNGQVSEETGFSQGFDEFRLEENPDAVDVRLSAWLDRRAGDRPFFLYLHYVDPHAPYEPAEAARQQLARDVDPKLGALALDEEISGAAQRRQWSRHFRAPDGSSPAGESPVAVEDLVALYDGAILTMDTRFGAFLSSLRARGIYEDTLLVFVADHGEEFDDHGGFSHGQTLYREQLHVPLIMRFPGNAHAGREVGTPVRQTDIAATIVQSVGADHPDAIDGTSVLDRLATPESDGTSSDSAPSVAVLEWLGVDAISVRHGAMKLIHHRLSTQLRPRYELFDLDADPAERHNLYFDRPVATGYLLSLLHQYEAPVQPGHEPLTVEIDGELAERLRALGYQP